MTTITIDVSQQCMDLSPGPCKATGANCPIWQAFKIALPGLSNHHVSRHAFKPYYLASAGDASRFDLEYLLPQQARDFIQAWDNGRRTDPFTFEISLPDVVLADGRGDG